MSGLYIFSAVAVIAVCLHALIVRAHLLRKLLALNMLGSGVFLLLAGVSARGGSTDPIPHAMILTGIVVAVGVTAFALALVRRLYEESGQPYLPDETGEEEEG